MSAVLNDPQLLALLTALLLVYCRIQACLLVLPGFSAPGLPVRLRVAIAMSMTPLLAEGVELAQPPAAPTWFAIGCAAEIVTGLALGALIRLFAMALDVAASAIAAAASLSQLMGAATEHAPHPVGNLFHLAGLAILMAMGFPLAVCAFLQSSLALRPVGSWPQISELLPLAVEMLWQGFVLALMLGAPFILGGYLFQILSGLVSKVMPALPITFIAAPGAILLALAALVILTPSIIAIWAGAVMDVLRMSPP